jgi:hypothetical protein
MDFLKNRQKFFLQNKVTCVMILLLILPERKIQMISNDEESVRIGDSGYKNPGIEAKGLLLRFLREKEKNYREPTRRGTPRGEAIGLSSKKYRATLLSLTSMDLISISKELGVSYGLLRKWRTEPGFKKHIEELIQEFAPLFIECLLKKWAVRDEEFAKSIKAGVISERIAEYYALRHLAPKLHSRRQMQLTKKDGPDLLAEDEVKFYAPPLKEVLIKKLFLLGDEDSFFFMFSPFITICRSLADEKSSRERLLSEVLDQQKNANQNIGELIEMSCGILKDPTRHESERDSALGWLERAKELTVMQERVTEELEKIIG